MTQEEVNKIISEKGFSGLAEHLSGYGGEA
jgi:hypothetical protein